MKQEELSRRRKEQMAASLKRLMARKPLHKITIQEIADDCGINRYTFYYHFQDIYDLLSWTFRQEGLSLIHQSDSCLTWEDGIRLFLRYVRDNAAVCRSAINSLGQESLRRMFHEEAAYLMRAYLLEIKGERQVPEGYLDFLKNQKLLTAGEMGLLFLCTLLAYDVPRAGLRRPLHPGFNFHSLVTLEVAISLADGFLALAEGRITYCPLVCLQLAAALWGLFLEDRATCAVMDTARKGPGTLTLVREPNLFQKLPGVLPGTGSEQEFLQANRLPAGPARLMDFYALAVLLLSAAVAGLTCRGTTATFFQYWTAVLLAGTPLAGAVAWSRPWCILSRRLQARGAALYGWTGACRLSGKLVVPISDQDLFPGESVKMNGVKYFGGHTPDQVVAYGSAVISAAGSGLSKIFEEQLEIRGARRYPVSKLRRYEVGGVGAEIGPDSVLVGSLRFMQSMGVDMPAGTRVSQAVYVAINGSLAGVFAVHYEVSRAVVGGLGALILSRGILPVITAGDFIITESFLRSKFRVNTARLKIPPFPARSELSQRTATEAARPCALLRQAPFSTISLTVTGARALRTAVRWGVLFDLLGGIMGMVIMAVLANLAASGVMSLVNLTLFLLLWSIPSLLLSGWPKNV